MSLKQSVHARFIGLGVASTLAVFSLACGKKVDPAAFDAGAPAEPVVAAAVPSAPVAADDASVAALASAPPVVKKVAPKVAPSAAAPRTDLPDCSNARTFCGSPKVTTDAKTKRLCEAFTAECKAKGGAL
ncbi:MAG: hypothetical protein IPG50_08485 [Myxococcales bacterium]|nr:hypothetical protein [Myxococcales bacterium]